MRRLVILMVAGFTVGWPAKAESTGAWSVELLVCRSSYIAVGTIVERRQEPGPGSAVYERYCFVPSQVLKGQQTERAEFALRTVKSGGDSAFVLPPREPVMVFLSEGGRGEDIEEAFRGWLSPTSRADPSSVFVLSRLDCVLIDRDFKVLGTERAILQACARALADLEIWEQQNPGAQVNESRVEVPIGSEAHAALFAGSSCSLILPSFLAPTGCER